MIFGPVLDIGLGSFGDVIIAGSLVLIMKNVLTGHVSVGKEVLNYYLLLVGLIFFYSFFNAFLDFENHGETIYQYLLRPIRVSITVLGAFYLIQELRRKYQDNLTPVIFKFVYLSITLHAIIMIWQFNDPVFRWWIYYYTNAKYEGGYRYLYRMAGLAGAGGAQLSVFMSFGFLLLPYLLKTVKRTMAKVLYIFFSILIAYSLVVCGRSGFLTILIFFPIITYLFTENKFLFFNYILAAFFALVLFFLGFTYYIENGNPDVTMVTAYERTFETYLQYQRSGDVEDKTISILLNHGLFLPNDIYTIIFGKAHYIDGSTKYRLVDSDVGYVRFLWSYGLIGSVINYLPYVFLIRFCSKNKNVDRYFSITIVMLCTATLFFHFKEIFVFTKNGYSILMLLFFSFVIETNNKKINVE